MTLGEIIQEENLVDFEKVIKILTFLQAIDLSNFKFTDTKYGISYYVTYYKDGFVYIEPDYYKDEPGRVQLRIPVQDLVDYEVTRV